MKRSAILILLSLVTALLLVACGGGGAKPDASGNITIELNEFTFSPDNIELEAGQEVTITLVNVGEKDHEFMVGRNVRTNEDGLPDGFAVQLFEDTPVVMRAGAVLSEEEMMGEHDMDAMEEGEEMEEDMEHDMDAMEEGEEMEEDMEHDMDAMEEGEEMEEDTEHDAEHDMDAMDEHGFMVEIPPAADTTTITFTVTEDMVGEWEFACFTDDGDHYNEGMKGILVIK
jgi:plastocyanin